MENSPFKLRMLSAWIAISFATFGCLKAPFRDPSLRKSADSSHKCTDEIINYPATLTSLVNNFGLQPDCVTVSDLFGTTVFEAKNTDPRVELFFQPDWAQRHDSGSSWSFDTEQSAKYENGEMTGDADHPDIRIHIDRPSDNGSYVNTDLVLPFQQRLIKQKHYYIKGNIQVIEQNKSQGTYTYNFDVTLKQVLGARVYTVRGQFQGKTEGK